jgi:hypothetical protein
VITFSYTYDVDSDLGVSLTQTLLKDDGGALPDFMVYDSASN